MTPEQEQKLNELYEWMQERKRQQIAFPLDLASKATIGALTGSGTGSAGDTDTINLTGEAESIQVPANPSGTLVVEFEGGQYELLLK